ncbi:Transcription factor MYB1R1, partial [Ananas comosus]
MRGDSGGDGAMRRCSQCGHNGHNARTCPGRGVRLFGVRIAEGSIRKSVSMGNISHYAAAIGGASPGDGGAAAAAAAAAECGDGYASEGFEAGNASARRERKKGVAWTEEEHRMFLVGLHKLGKGDWRGISRNFVITRTPTQPADIQLHPTTSQELEEKGINTQPALLVHQEEHKPTGSSSNDGERDFPKAENFSRTYPVIFPAYFPPFVTFPYPSWPIYGSAETVEKAHQIIKPTAVHSKAPLNVDDLVGMSQLSLGAKSSAENRVSPLSLEVLHGSGRQSAFHAKLPAIEIPELLVMSCLFLAKVTAEDEAVATQTTE